jgi:sigma-B regulation protein RsbU (phosphoserine phosphatase)
MAGPGDSDQDDPERTLLRRPNALAMAVADELVHVLVRQPGGIAPPFRLRPGATTIGRAEGVDLMLPGIDVSRRHCRIDLVGGDIIAGGEVLLTDLNSTNGTYVNATRVSGTVALTPGARIAIGSHQLVYQRRGRRELDEAEALERELHSANQQVLAILPLPRREGPIRAEWFYVPSTSLGGDAFGYRELGDGSFVGYMIDVEGEGAAAAMRAVELANLLRQDGLAGTDLRDPAAVMTRLNETVRPLAKGGPAISAWYWAYRPGARTLAFCGAGWHAACLADRAGERLATLVSDNPALGLRGDTSYAAREVSVPAGASLYAFSDGAFAIEDRAGRRWGVAELIDVIRAPAVPDITEPQRVYNAVREAAKPGPLADDFCLVTVSFL